MSKLTVLQLLNLTVGVEYVLLSIGFASMWSVLDSMMGRRRLDVGPRVWLLAVLGSALFLAGCGFHHFHLALEMIPTSIERFGKDSLWVQNFTHETIIDSAQAIGAPMVLYAGWAVRRASRLREAKRPQHDRRQG